MNSRVLKAWTLLLAPYGIPHARRLESYQHIIHPAYTEPHRAYHTDRHLEHCLDVVDDMIPYVDDVAAIVLALFFHDIVYDTKAANGKNEEESRIRMAAMAHRLGLPHALTVKAADAINATFHDGRGLKEIVERYVVDVDLSILGTGTGDEYDREYAWKIREEYSWVPDLEYKTGRIKVLQGFLDRPSIYNTELFRERYEKRAREHLTREIGFLRREAS